MLRRLTAAALVLLTLAADPAASQTEAVASDVLIRRPAVGLTARLPVGAEQTSMEIAGRRTTRIVLPGEAGIVNITDHTLNAPRPLSEVATQIIQNQLGTVSETRVDPSAPGERAPVLESANGAVLERSTRVINGKPAEIFFLDLASVGDSRDAFGYAVFMPAANTVAVIQLLTPAPVLPKARPYFDVIVDSVRISDPELTDLQREIGVEAGLNFFQGLSPSDYERVIENFGEDWKFERYFTPSPSGADSDAKELGYRRTRFARGTRAELKGLGTSARSPSERQQGYLVFQEARVLNADYIVDVSAAFFMTPDRRQEAWSIRQSVKARSALGQTAAGNTVETGIREGNALSVVQSRDGKPFETVNPLIEGKGYISRVEVYMLPHLLLQTAQTGTFRFYAYNQLAKKITLREDIFIQPEDTPGLWKYTSRPDEESLGQTAFFNALHEPMRAELPKGDVWEPITLENLYTLWREKNLPLD